jgi:hypothetical protein
MTDTPGISRFELAARELRALGIAITRLPGEYAVNYLNGKPDTAACRENLDEAIALGRIMAQEAPAAAARKAAAYVPRRRLSMKPKAVIRRRIKAHNRRIRARAIKEQRENGR